MMNKKYEKTSCIVCLIYIIAASDVSADIVLDGSLGQSGALSGPDFNIEAEMGQQQGSNLFHSFSSFNLSSAETATFNGPADITTIVGSISGGAPSTINGQINSNIAGASLFLINPSGIVFGENASLNISGSFYATTADYLALSDGGRVDANIPTNSVLSSAPISAFGFLDSDIAAIDVYGSTLTVDSGKTIALIGGDISLNGSQDPALNVEGSRAGVGANQLYILSGYTGSEIGITNNAIDLLTGNYSGKITLENAELSSSGDGAGTVYIRAGEISLSELSWIHAANTGETNASQVGVDMVIEDTITLSSFSVIDTDTRSTGSGGSVNVTAGKINISDKSSIRANSYSSAQGGDLNINVWALSIEGSYRSYTTGVTSESTGGGSSGDVNITATSIDMDNYGQIYNLPYGYGATSGDINIKTGSLDIRGAATISNNTYFATLGYAGKIDIEAAELNITGVEFETDSPFFYDATGIRSGTVAGSSRDILIDADNITLSNRALIQNSDFWSGEAGDIRIDFDALNVLSGSQIVSGTYGAKDGGSLILTGGALQVSGVHSSTYSNSPIPNTPPLMSSSALASQSGVNGGNAGDIIIRVDSLSVQDGGRVTANTLGSGNAGDINIISSGLVDISGRNQIYQDYLTENNLTNASVANSLVSTESANFFLGDAATGAAGTISINAEEIIVSDYAILRSSSFTSGNAGDVNLTTNDLRVMNQGSIVANANDSGDSGSINISTTNNVFISDSNISTSTFYEGKGGGITIEATDIEIRSSNIATRSEGAGDSGSIRLTADTISLVNDNVSAQSTSSGSAGDITVSAKDRIVVKDSDVSTRAEFSDGGNITFVADTLVHLVDSVLSTSVGGTTGNGGNINIDPLFVVLENSDISANAVGGRGGNINIVTSNLLVSADSSIEASSELGVDGDVVFDVSNKAEGNELETLPDSLPDIPKLFRSECGAVDSGYSSFTLAKLGSIASGEYSQFPGRYIPVLGQPTVKVDDEQLNYVLANNRVVLKQTDCRGRKHSARHLSQIKN